MLCIVLTGAITQADVEWEGSGWEKEGSPIRFYFAGEVIHLGLAENVNISHDECWKILADSTDKVW